MVLDYFCHTSVLVTCSLGRRKIFLLRATVVPRVPPTQDGPFHEPETQSAPSREIATFDLERFSGEGRGRGR